MFRNAKLCPSWILAAMLVACGTPQTAKPASTARCMDDGYVVDAHASRADRAWADRTRQLASSTYEAPLAWTASGSVSAPSDTVINVRVQPKGDVVCAVLDCSVHPDGVESLSAEEKERVCPRALAIDVTAHLASNEGTFEQSFPARLLSRRPSEAVLETSRWDDARLRERLHVPADLGLQETLTHKARGEEAKGTLDVLLHDHTQGMGRGGLTATWSARTQP